MVIKAVVAHWTRNVRHGAFNHPTSFCTITTVRFGSMAPLFSPFDVHRFGGSVLNQRRWGSKRAIELLSVVGQLVFSEASPSAPTTRHAAAGWFSGDRLGFCRGQGPKGTETGLVRGGRPRNPSFWSINRCKIKICEDIRIICIIILLTNIAILIYICQIRHLPNGLEEVQWSLFARSSLQ